MWALKLLAFTIALLVFAGIAECGRKRSSRCSPPSCRVSFWSHWSRCSHQCGTRGTQTRKRKRRWAYLKFELSPSGCGASFVRPLKKRAPVSIRQTRKKNPRFLVEAISLYLRLKTLKMLPL